MAHLYKLAKCNMLINEQVNVQAEVHVQAVN